MTNTQQDTNTASGGVAMAMALGLPFINRPNSSKDIVLENDIFDNSFDNTFN